MSKKTIKKTMTEEEARAELTGYGCVCGKCEFACVQAFYSKGGPNVDKKAGFRVSALCQSKETGRKLSTRSDFCSCCSRFSPIGGPKEYEAKRESGTGSPRSTDLKSAKEEKK